jgi:hypothetical protein
MMYGPGSGRGMGSGARNGIGRGIGGGMGGGRGFGFRGSSPSWPYVGRGRGGLPRCGYFSGGTGINAQAQPYRDTPYYSETGDTQMTREEELESLKNQARTIDDELKFIRKRIEDIEGAKQE